MNVSALQSLELIERLHAYDSVSVPEIEVQQSVNWVGTCLGIAGASVLIGEGELQEIIETPNVTPIPGTKPWVLGVAAFKGGLLPILSGDVFFRKRPYTGAKRDYCMVVNRSGLRFGMTLSSIKRDRRFPIDERVMDHPVDPDFAEFTLGGFEDEKEFLVVLDLDKLVANEDLANAAAEQVSSHKGENHE